RQISKPTRLLMAQPQISTNDIMYALATCWREALTPHSAGLRHAILTSFVGTHQLLRLSDLRRDMFRVIDFMDRCWPRHSVASAQHLETRIAAMAAISGLFLVWSDVLIYAWKGEDGAFLAAQVFGGFYLCKPDCRLETSSLRIMLRSVQGSDFQACALMRTRLDRDSRGPSP